jgi:hypothetical protein
MLHPALTRALATTHIEDQLRAAARWRTIRLARRARATRDGDFPAIRVDSTTSTAPAQTDGMTPTEIPQAARWPCQSVVVVRSGARAGIDRTSSKARTASSHTRTSRRSE